MAHNFGAVTLPASASDDPIGDPGLRCLADFMAAVINEACTTAWQAVEPAPPDPPEEPAPPPVAALPVMNVLLHDPQKRGFNEFHLPALFAWRERGKPGQNQTDRFEDVDQIELMWIFPAIAREEGRNRDPFSNLVKKVVGFALSRGRTPTWVDPGDDDPTAATTAADPDAFLLSKTTQLAPVTYSGAGLDGALGDDVLSPRLGLTISFAAASAGTPYSTVAPIVVTYISIFGLTVTASLFATSTSAAHIVALGSDIKQLVSIAFPAQLDTTGAISAGVVAYAGRGSSLFGRAGFDRLTFTAWKTTELAFDVLDGSQRASKRLPHHGILMTFEAVESLGVDPSALPGVVPSTGAGLTVLQGEPFDDGGAFTIERTLD